MTKQIMNLIAKLFLFFNKQSTYLINGNGVSINEIYDKQNNNLGLPSNNNGAKFISNNFQKEINTATNPK